MNLSASARKRASLCLAAIVLLAIGVHAQNIAIPSYVQPGSRNWKIWAAYPQIVKIMIVNLNNGDDTKFYPSVLSAVQLAQASGIKVLGYTYTHYGQRNPATVKQAINAVRSNYGVDGIFLDEAPTSCTDKSPFAANTYQYFQDLSNTIRAFGGMTVMNPGTPTPTDCWMSVTDILVNYENSGITNYSRRYADMAWVHNYTADRFWHLLYSVKKKSEMLSAFKLAKQRNAGWIYVTSDGGDGNPWDGIPSYWTAEVSPK
jgi:hypothetical protein